MAKRYFLTALLLAGAVMPEMAAAQFTDSYVFLKAVRERDGSKATDILAKPGSVLIDTRDRTTGEAGLHIVTRARDLVWLNFLLGKGAKADIRDKDGNSPLMISSQLRFIEGATQLLRYKAQVDLANNSGETPLIRAVQLRDAPMVRLLLTNGANPDKTDTIAGYSARDYAKRDARGAAILKLLDELRVKRPAVAGPKL